jgi:hypothetical protein
VGECTGGRRPEEGYVVGYPYARVCVYVSLRGVVCGGYISIAIVIWNYSESELSGSFKRSLIICNVLVCDK